MLHPDPPFHRFQVTMGLLTVGDLVLINTLFFQLAGPLNHVGDVYRGISQATTDMENMFAILDEAPQVTCVHSMRYTCPSPLSYLAQCKEVTPTQFMQQILNEVPL